jgi:Na+-transporting NADH:ubiquinone oxidoreductase subunit NqrF
MNKLLTTLALALLSVAAAAAEPNITLTREKSFRAGGCAIPVYVDGEKVGALKNGGSLPLTIAPGSRVISVGTACGKDIVADQTELTVTEGQTYRYNVFIGGADILSGVYPRLLKAVKP